MSRETECTGKKTFNRYNTAKRAAQRRNMREDYKWTRSYKCTYCTGWHHTTKPKIEEDK